MHIIPNVESKLWQAIYLYYRRQQMCIFLMQCPGGPCLALGPGLWWCAQEVCLFPFFPCGSFCSFLKVTLLVWFPIDLIFCALKMHQEKERYCWVSGNNVLCLETECLAGLYNFFIRKITVILKWSAKSIFMFSSSVL